MEAETHTPVVAVIGLGLLGGSLGLALGRCGIRRIGWARRAETRKKAEETGAVDAAYSDLEQALREADTAVLALPIPVIIDFLPVCAKVCRKGAVVTDIGSIRAGIVSRAEEVFTSGDGPFFVGSHPMAGTEKSGLAAAFPELYDNADVFITPVKDANEGAVKQVEEMWQKLSCHTSRLDARSHDLLVARTSHALHVVASALSLDILGSGGEEEKILRFRGCATGFKDTSRISSSSPRMWREIVESNQPAVLEALEGFERELDRLKNLIARGDFDGFEREFARGKALRDSWLEYKKMK
jgi:prephenate dehydrogenase